MKILKNNIEGFIKNIAKESAKGALLFGSDIGVIMGREAEIIKQLKGFEVIKLDLNGEAKISDIFSESFTLSLFGNQKLIICYGSPSKFNEIEAVLGKLGGDFPNFILVSISENLDSKSKLKKIFEDGKLLASIPCFPDEEADTVAIIRQFFTENKLIAEPEIIKYIALNFNGNREILKLELAKLKTYKGSGKVSLLEVKAVMEELSEGDMFEAINYFFSLNFRTFLKEIQVLKEESLPASAIVSGLINYHFKLIEILEEKEETKKTLDTLLNEKFVFFKQIPKMKDHLSKWNKQMLNHLSSLLLETEIEVRKNFDSGYELLTNLTGKVLQS